MKREGADCPKPSVEGPEPSCLARKFKVFCRMVKFVVTSLVMTAAPVALAEQDAGDARADRPTAGTTASDASIPAQPAPTSSATPAVESGVASVYASDLEGRPTASGALYDGQKLTAAHRSLPLGSRIRVTDAASGKIVSVTVNDRWSGGPGQIVNLSRRAADELGMRGNGQRKVEITVEALGDGRRRPSPAGSSPRLLPERVEATSSNAAGRARVCANEADILGLRDSLWESHVRNCLGRKSKSAATAEAKAR